ncbi:PREDICTED: auxin-responsive protein IAA28 [Tarenaya hassleriana]|uniref:auxin-responsive protein IAA28 n=1 Tax=Tarenaya hassleriana TaxID=28532 RepID=UPI00053C0BFC|nr:PREDICTED: auxin-responsive protein IAA28 [Tarenaya hassleriana]
MEEEKRLELRLGPPGDQFTCNNNGGRRRTFQNSFSSSSANKEAYPVPNKRVEVAPVVGWPPVRTFRRNLAGIGASQRAKEKDHSERKEEREMYVKINMEGVPIGRKVNLSTLTDYQQLSTTVDRLFSGLLAIQMNSTVDGDEEEGKTNDQSRGKDSWDPKRQYTLVYEDTDGDRVLVGDVPWGMFVSTVKRLHVLKTFEVSSLSPGRRGERGPPT